MASKIGGITAGVSASHISDIASAVWAAKFTTHSNVSSFGSLMRDVISSKLSDIQSYLVGMSDMLSNIQSELSDVHSDLGSKVGAIPTSVSASDMSDIASRVWARAGADATGVPAVTGTMQAKMDWLFAMSRNKITQTATSTVLFNDASVAVASATVADDGTIFTRGDWH